MALLSAYATAAEYRSRTNKTDIADDADILAQLTAMSRMLERECRVAPGTWNAGTASESRYFTPVTYANRLLRLVDELGFQHVITTIDNNGIAVDSDGDGDYDYTIDPAGETWVVARPAIQLGRPYESLELFGFTTATFNYWPNYPRAVRVTGTWGWSAVPEPIKEMVIKMTRDIRDSQEAGAAGLLSGSGFKTDTWRLWLSLKSEYSYESLVLA